MNSNTTMNREEQRKARARLEHERHIAKVKKEKAWLAANPHIAAQQEREKEEQRKNRETLRMLKAMKDEELALQKKNKKPKNVFAALMDDSDTEDEETETKHELRVVSNDTVECPTPTNEVLPEKKFVWADECDE